jgi:cell division protein FtsW
MVYSASIAMAEAERFTGFKPTYFLVRHGMFLAIGLAVALALFRVPVWLWQKASPWLFVLGIVMLIAVLIPGVGKGSERREALDHPRVHRFQPSSC